MGPRKRAQPDRSELEDLVAKHARIEEFGEEQCNTGRGVRFDPPQASRVWEMQCGGVTNRFSH